jgi:hypothetical protein
MTSAQSRPRWLFLFRPKWLGWHAFAVFAAVGMLWLGDWQLRRAEAGNGLSWAYTFEWPLFALLGAAFWVKTIFDEFRSPGAASHETDETDPQTETDPPNEAGAGATDYVARLTAEVRGHGRWHGLR